MALNKLKYNSLNVTPVANKAISFDSDPDALEATLGGGAMTFISKSTASSSSTISFTSGIDSTYKEYIFIFKDIHPATDQQSFSFQVDTGTNTNYNQTITSTLFRAKMFEDGSSPFFQYETGSDQAQGTGFQPLATEIGNGDKESATGYLHLFNPSSTTFVKHFISRIQSYSGSSYPTSQDNYIAGYVNTTTALTRIQFKMSSGNIDAGTITLYGIN